MKYLLLLMALLAAPAFADPNHSCEKNGKYCEGPPGPQGEQGEQGEQGPQGVAGADGQDGGTVDLSGYSYSSDTNGVMAGAVALDQIDFGNSTEQFQIGVGVGYYAGENAVAVGVGKLLPDQDIMLRGSMTYINSDTAIGAGMTWKW